MSREDQARWDERFRTGSHAGANPDPFLFQLEDYWELLPEHGRALDLACGPGRNAVWFGEKVKEKAQIRAEERGIRPDLEPDWSITGFDISLEGLRKARALACERAVHLDLACVDLDTPPPCEGRFDLILCFSFLDRELFSWIRSALRPGGLVVYKTYTVESMRFTGGPRNERFLLRPQELLEYFRDFRVLLYQETVKDRGVAQMIARKKQ